MIELQFNKNTNRDIWDRYGKVISLDLQEAMRSTELTRMLEMLFPNYFEMRDNCQVQFLTPEEMKHHENRRNDEEIRENAIALINKILDFYDEEFLIKRDLKRVLDYGKKIIKTGKDEEGNSPQYAIKQMSIDLKEFIESKSDGEYTRGKEKILIQLLEELYDYLKMIRFDIVLFGCYNRKNSTIYLCLENIEKAASKRGYNSFLFVEIAKSVLVHEFVHCIHYHYMKQRQRIIENAYLRIKKEAVIETVAECVQHYYLQDILQSSKLDSWIPNHSMSGVFPAWGYGGEEIVRNYCERNGKSFVEVLKKEIQITKLDWRKAYSFLESMELLNEL